MTNDDDFTIPTEGIAELRRRCPTPEETDALCDRAERLAAIERDVAGVADNLASDRDYSRGQAVEDLRAILDSEGS